jgi:uncharacterized membrane protein (DUF106 family)
VSDAAPATPTPTATVSIPLPAAVATATEGVRLWRTLTPTEGLIFILVVMIGLMIVGLYMSVSYAVNTAIPQHLASIKEGYKELQSDDQKAREEIEKRHDERLKAFGEKWSTVAEKLEATMKMQESLVREIILRNRQGMLDLPIHPGEA